MKDIFTGKKVLITGGVGTIGSALVKEILKRDVHTLRILDNHEFGLFKLHRDINDDRVRFLLGDIRDYKRMDKACEDIDIVFHAAALKQVFFCEYNPTEAFKTNIVGAQNVIDAAYNNDVDKVISISTDKAVNPVSTMGASKLLGERLMLDADAHKGMGRTSFSCVRFGNVLFATASVLPIFKKCIDNNETLPIHNPDMTRFFMPINGAIRLIMRATELSQGGEIFVLKMPSVKIIDLAKAMANVYGDSSYKFRTEIIGSRKGEKTHEELITKYEGEDAYENHELIAVSPNHKPVGFKRIKNLEYTSNTSPMSLREIELMLKENLIE